MMKSSESSIKHNTNLQTTEMPLNQKPPFRPAKDDTKPVLQDPKYGHIALINEQVLHHSEAVLSRDVNSLPQQRNICLRIANDSLVKDLQDLKSFMPQFVFSESSPFSLSV
ncbi:hypothetical protein G2W53_001587 [Senna tora]|uniref:Uncharacterized protein n=1 Tax=Senna tora TaxID=362788 RepID=A0A835CMP1_9FABA|nr:hypothetical protein G2W53_001587 [Senna tora]